MLRYDKQKLEAIAVNLDMNPVLRPYEVTSKPYGAIRAIQALAQYRSTNSFIYEMGYYIRGSDYIYTSTSAYRKDSFFRDFFRQPGFDSVNMMSMMEDCTSPMIIPVRQTQFLNKQVNLLTFLYPLPIQGGQYATAIFFVDEKHSVATSVKSVNNFTLKHSG